MDTLEKTKKANAETNDAFKDDIVAQAVIEEYALKLFDYADAEDRAEKFGKNVIKVIKTIPSTGVNRDMSILAC